MRRKLFLLSYEEFASKIAHGKDFIVHYPDGPWWWLRTKGNSGKNVLGAVSGNGLECANYNIASRTGGVRPAFYFKKEWADDMLLTDGGTIHFGGDDCRYEWLVLDAKKGLVIAAEPICMHNFDSLSNMYKGSTIDMFLNDELIYRLFTDDEIEWIADAQIDGEHSFPVDEAKCSKGNEKDDEKEEHSSGGMETEAVDKAPENMVIDEILSDLTNSKSNEDNADYQRGIQKAIGIIKDKVKEKKKEKTKKLYVTVCCEAYYSSAIDVPENMDLEEAIEYAKKHIDEIPVSGELEYAGHDELDVNNCEFDPE